MLIRKLFKTEGPAHVVRNCSTDRCSRSLHGHSYKWEVLLEGEFLDEGAMIVDFGLFKDEIKHFIDLMDHCHMQWDKDIDVDYFQDYSERYIRVPFSPSAESLAIFGFQVIERILDKTVFANGENSVTLHSVICHETETGYAQAFACDAARLGHDLEAVFIKHDENFWDTLLASHTRYYKSRPEHQL